ncbi:B-cell translocation protein [Sarcoptes scabiei]|nr:B-cell translocation protein [Sarcoptes scabiei]
MDTDLIRARTNQHNESDSQENLKFDLNEEVLAQWDQTKSYPAKIISYLKGQYCRVLFYDGFKKKVKINSLQKMPENYQGEHFPSQNITKSSNLVNDQTIEQNNSICETCGKGFRKESLLLQHKKHFHKIELDIDDVPSIVPPQLRINKSSRASHHSKESTGENSGTDSNKVKHAVTDSETSGDSDLESLTLRESGEKRKIENSKLIIDNSDSKKSKIETKTSDSNSSSSLKDQPLNSSQNTSLSNSNSSNWQNVPMKPLIVKIPSRKCTKPNNTLPFRDARQEAEEHENDNIEEFVKCICPLDEESGLMVQCELCFTWQHGSCMGFKREEDVPPHGYFCQFCRFPLKSVRSQKNSYQLNYWLKMLQCPQFNQVNDYAKNNSQNNDFRITSELSHHSAPKTPNKWNKLNKINSDYLKINRKSFTLHDLTSRSESSNFESVFDHPIDSPIHHRSGENFSRNFVDSDSSTREIGSSLFYDRHLLAGENDEEDELIPIRGTNQLSSALYDCMLNLHSLNYKIHQNSPENCKEIASHQQKLMENLLAIQNKVDAIEKILEQKDSLAYHTSSSTLSATSPENYGISNEMSQISTANNYSFSATGMHPSNSSLIENRLMNEINDNSNDQQHSTVNSCEFSPNENSGLKAIDVVNNRNNISINSSSNLTIADDSQSLNQSKALARLFIANSNVSSIEQESSIDLSTNRLPNRPSMSHDYLPLNLTDGEMKLELAYHYKDLQLAKEIILLASR